MLQLLKTSLSPFGRCNRWGLVRLTCALIAIQIAAAVLMWAAGVDFEGPAALVLNLGFAWFGFCAISKRLHDIGLTAWWIPAFLVAMMVWSFLQTMVLFWAAGPAILDIYGPMFWVSLAGLLSPLIVVTVWVHYARGCAQANRHGPPPGPTGVSHPLAVNASPAVAVGGA